MHAGTFLNVSSYNDIANKGIRILILAMEYISNVKIQIIKYQFRWNVLISAVDQFYLT